MTAVLSFFVLVIMKIMFRVCQMQGRNNQTDAIKVRKTGVFVVIMRKNAHLIDINI